MTDQPQQPNFIPPTPRTPPPPYGNQAGGTPGYTQGRPSSNKKYSTATLAALVAIGFLAGLVVGLLIPQPTSIVEVPVTPPPASPSVAAPGPATPPTAIENTAESINYGNPNAKVSVDIYYDFMCPYCGEMERTLSKDLKQLADDDIAYLKYRPMSFLDSTSLGARYSTRAANAFLTIGKADPNKAVAFADKLWENQPQEGTEGLTDADLAAYAKEVGVSDEIIKTLPKLTNEAWVEESTVAANASGVTGTPAIAINGELVAGGSGQPTVSWNTPGALVEAIRKAANG